MEIFLTTIQIILIVCLFLLALLIIQTINNVINQTTSVLLNINEDLKRSAYNNTMFDVLKVNMIKNFKSMKIKIQILVLLIVMCVSAIGFASCARVSNNCKENFKTVLDSINSNNKKVLDSLFVEIQSLNDSVKVSNSKFDSIKEINESLKKSNTNLNNVIKHQNTMISNLKKELDSKK